MLPATIEQYLYSQASLNLHTHFTVVFVLGALLFMGGGMTITIIGKFIVFNKINIIGTL